MVEIFFKNTKKNRKNVKKNYFFLNTKIFLFNQLINNALELKQKKQKLHFPLFSFSSSHLLSLAFCEKHLSFTIFESTLMGNV